MDEAAEGHAEKPPTTTRLLAGRMTAWRIRPVDGFLARPESTLNGGRGCGCLCPVSRNEPLRLNDRNGREPDVEGASVPPRVSTVVLTTGLSLCGPVSRRPSAVGGYPIHARKAHAGDTGNRFVPSMRSGDVRRPALARAVGARPLYLPAAAAAAMPSRCLSSMISRSNVATAPSMVSRSLLVGFRVSSC